MIVVYDGFRDGNIGHPLPGIAFRVEELADAVQAVELVEDGEAGYVFVGIGGGGGGGEGEAGGLGEGDEGGGVFC